MSESISPLSCMHVWRPHGQLHLFLYFYLYLYLCLYIETEVSVLPVCEAVSYEWFTKIWRFIMPTSSGLNNFKYLSWIAWLWKMKTTWSSKRLIALTQHHFLISQTDWILNNTAGKTSLQFTWSLPSLGAEGSHGTYLSRSPAAARSILFYFEIF